MLELKGVTAAYGAKQVLFGVDISVAAGEVVSLMGRNGMGKTTTVHCVIGFCGTGSGSIRFNGEEIAGLAPHLIARRGIGLVPEGRRIFPNLSVHENLVATASEGARSKKRWTAERVYGLFPRLFERRRNMGGQLSGGEQQMLSIGRALMTNPLLLILDEATEGLAPLVRLEIWRCIERLKSAGQSILLIDKDIAVLTRIASRHHILEKGKVVWCGDSDALRADPSLWRRYLGV